MRFKVDENLPAEVATDLVDAGHEADTVEQQGLTGTPDPALLERVRAEGRAFLTMDKGVADVRQYPPEQYAGIVLFRPRSSGRGYVLAFVRSQVADLLQLDLDGHLFVVSDPGSGSGRHICRAGTAGSFRAPITLPHSPSTGIYVIMAPSGDAGIELVPV